MIKNSFFLSFSDYHLSVFLISSSINISFFDFLLMFDLSSVSHFSLLCPDSQSTNDAITFSLNTRTSHWRMTFKRQNHQVTFSKILIQYKIQLTDLLLLNHSVILGFPQFQQREELLITCLTFTILTKP